MHNDTFILARQGWKPVGISLAVLGVFSVIEVDLFQLLAVLAAALFAWVFRNPERITPYFQSGSIVSPVDGTVRSIETVEKCDVCDAPCYRIEISSAYFDTSILRVPFESNVTVRTLRRGARLPAFSPLAKELNEKVSVAFEGGNGQRMIGEHQLDMTGFGVDVTASGEHASKQGSRYGTMVKGTSTLYLPANSRINLHVGETVRAGETLVGYFTVAADEK